MTNIERDKRKLLDKIEGKERTGGFMTDDEKAKEIVLAADLAYSYLQIPVPLRVILEKEIANALAAVREDCAKVAEEFPWTLTAGSENIPMVDMDALVDAIRTGPSRPSEGEG